MTRQTLEETLVQDPNYVKILDACQHALLTGKASFLQDDILRETGLRNMAKAIRWDVVVRLLEKPPYNFSLMAVAESFFKERVWLKIKDFTDATEAEAMALAGRYTATGHGKRTLGYCLAKLHGGRLLLYRLNVESKKRNGIESSMRDKALRNLNDPSIDAATRAKLCAVAGVPSPEALN